MSLFAKQQILNGHYEVIDFINQGFFSFIYTAKDLESNLEVAVKQLKFEDESEVKHEYDTLILLDPLTYCPTPLEFGAEPQNASFFIISWEGKSLHELEELNNNNKFTSNTTSLILYHTFVAIKFIHERGIAHGDMSSKNVGIPKSAEKGRIILYDFGCSAPANPITSRQDILDIMTITGEISTQNRTFNKCRDALENDPSTSVETLIEMVSEETMFNPDARFDWELE